MEEGSSTSWFASTACGSKQQLRPGQQCCFNWAWVLTYQFLKQRERADGWGHNGYAVAGQAQQRQLSQLQHRRRELCQLVIIEP